VQPHGGLRRPTSRACADANGCEFPNDAAKRNTNACLRDVVGSTAFEGHRCRKGRVALRASSSHGRETIHSGRGAFRRRRHSGLSMRKDMGRFFSPASGQKDSHCRHHHGVSGRDVKCSPHQAG